MQKAAKPLSVSLLRGHVKVFETNASKSWKAFQPEAYLLQVPAASDAWTSWHMVYWSSGLLSRDDRLAAPDWCMKFRVLVPTPPEIFLVPDVCPPPVPGPGQIEQILAFVGSFFLGGGERIEVEKMKSNRCTNNKRLYKGKLMKIEDWVKKWMKLR